MLSLPPWYHIAQFLKSSHLLVGLLILCVPDKTRSSLRPGNRQIWLCSPSSHRTWRRRGVHEPPWMGRVHWGRGIASQRPSSPRASYSTLCSLHTRHSGYCVSCFSPTQAWVKLSFLCSPGFSEQANNNNNTAQCLRVLESDHLGASPQLLCLFDPLFLICQAGIVTAPMP